MYKKIFTAFFCLCNLLILFSQPSLTDSLTLKWKYFKLKNGIRVILQPDNTQAEVSVEFWIHTGARNETPGKFGFAHFFEHATPYGLKGNDSLLRQFLVYRTNSNAQTRKDYTRYYIQVKPAGLPLALKYTADRLQSDTSLIYDSTIQKHKQNVLNEIARQESNPFYGATSTAARETGTFGKNHPYAHSTYGSIEENKMFTTHDVKDWYEHYFYPSNIVLFVVGNFDIQKLEPLVKKEFEAIDKKNKRDYFIKPGVHTAVEKASVDIPAKSNQLSITWAIPKFNTADEPALQLLSLILDQRLKKQPPFSNSITQQGASDLYNIYEWAGQFGIYANFTSLADSNKIEGYFYSLLHDIIKNGISATELENAKETSIKDTKIQLAKPGFIGSRTELLGESLLFSGDPNFYLKRINKQSQLKIDDIKKVAAKWLSNDGFRLLAISSTQ